MRKVTRSMPEPASLGKKTVQKAKAKAGAAGAAPAGAGGVAGAVAKTELQRAAEHYAQPLPASGKHPAFTFKAYKADDVRTRLLKDFFDKCAYCESRYATTAPVEIEHYRPKGRIKGETHSGYWWLAMSWDNLLPACIDCNRHRKQATPTPKPGKALGLDEAKGAFTSSLVLTTGKQDAFPITGTRLAAQSLDYGVEGALLLDPCRDDPDAHLHFYMHAKAPLGLVLPKANGGSTTLAHLTPVPDSKTATDICAHAATVGASARGAVSIQTYGLNRLQLVRERTRVLRRLEFFEHLLIHITRLIQDLQAPGAHPDCKDRNDRAVASLKTMQTMITAQIGELAVDSSPYSAMVKAWVSDFRSRIAASP